MNESVQARTLVDLLRHRACVHPDRAPYTYLVDGEREEESLAVGELDRRARAVGAWLQRAGAAGERVLLLYPAGLEFIEAFFGCLYAGAVAVPSYPPRGTSSIPRIRSIARDAQPRLAMTTREILAQLGPRLSEFPDLGALQWIAIADLPPGVETDWREPAIDESTLAFLQYTSGSTASPKGVMVSHANLLYNDRMLQRGLVTSEDTVMVSWLPLFHDMGLIGNVLHTQYVNCRLYCMAPEAFLLRPARWLEAITRYRGTHSYAPNFAFDLCVSKIPPDERAGLDLSSWAAAINGAEPIRHDTIDRFVQGFAAYGFRREAFKPGYGLAEATLIVSAKLRPVPPTFGSFDRGALERHTVVEVPLGHTGAVTLVGCGQNVHDQEIEIVDPDTCRRCAADRVGEIWVKGPSVTQGYWNRPEETERTFRAHLADTGEGPFLRTGDMAFLRGGELFIAGRIKDMLILNGRNLYPQDVELTVERSHASLRAGCGAAFPIELDGHEHLVVVQEVKPVPDLDVAESLSAIRMAVPRDHGVHPLAVVLIKAQTIPKTSSGKLMRHAARAQFLSNSLTVIGEYRAPSMAAPATHLSTRTT